MRLYHRDPRCPDAVFARSFGPLHRFDHQVPGRGDRRVIYLAERLSTAAFEVWSDLGVAPVCPSVRVALVRPLEDVVVQNLRGRGALLIGAKPSLATSNEPRALTQAWARAIYEDHPGGPGVCGVRYSSAHDEGPCLALWDTAPGLRVVEHRGRAQDFPAAHPSLWPRLLVAMQRIGLPAEQVGRAECPRCLHQG
ncbi:MAG: RES family NAD+ phosphorylase [Acidimicrobiales bacterium]